MTEKLFQYIWQHTYFNTQNLQTQAGEPVRIILPGILNRHQGPDFSGARIQVGPALLAGSVELHLRTSDWQRHGHSGDPRYRNVILHVVHVHDRSFDLPIPVLELQAHIPHILLQRYESLMQEPGAIPCAASIASVDPLVWTSWKDRLLAERLGRKSAGFLQLLEQGKGNWEECFWWQLARNFGMTVNADLFERMARSLPWRLLLRHRNSIHQLEALLLGQANLLEGIFKEDYPQLLQREYRYLQKKYRLAQVSGSVSFLRMRPGNFPTLRLAQLAMLLHRQGPLFTQILEAARASEILKLLEVTANDYWHYHYRFDTATAFAPKRLGGSMIESILVNTVIPVIYAYGKQMQMHAMQSRALQWLSELPPEVNSICESFLQLSVTCTSAFDSQALIELKNTYCTPRRCLECAVGNAVLKRNFPMGSILPRLPS